MGFTNSNPPENDAEEQSGLDDASAARRAFIDFMNNNDTASSEESEDDGDSSEDEWVPDDDWQHSRDETAAVDFSPPKTQKPKAIKRRAGKAAKGPKRAKPSSTLSRGGWTAAQDDKLREFVSKHMRDGDGTVRGCRWSVIGRALGKEGRNACRNRWTGTLDPTRVSKKSSVNGVYWHKGKKRWEVKFFENGRLRNVGTYISQQEAEKVATSYRKPGGATAATTGSTKKPKKALNAPKRPRKASDDLNDFTNSNNDAGAPAVAPDAAEQSGLDDASAARRAFMDFMNSKDTAASEGEFFELL